MTGYYRSVKRRRVGRTARRTFLSKGVYGATRRRRRFRRRRNATAKYSSGLHVKAKSIPGTFGVTLTPGYSFPLKVNLQEINTAANTELGGYVAIYDYVKIKKVVMEYWIADNDEITAVNQVPPRVHAVYDPIANGRTMSLVSTQIQPKSKMTLMKPMTKYRVSMTPLWSLRTSGVTGAVAHEQIKQEFIQNSNKNNYMASHLLIDNVDTQCVNSLQQWFLGTPGLDISYTLTWYMHFKNRTQAVNYNPI